jgi:phosphoglycolate phosphatase
MDLMGKLIIFDMDGTLIDSDKTIIRCMEEASSHFGYRLHSVRENIGILKLDEILRLNGIPERNINEILVFYKKCYSETFNLDTEPVNKSVETLEYLQNKNRLGVLTLKYEDLTRKLLEYFFRNVKFEFLVGGDSGIRNKTEGLKRIVDISGVDSSQIYYVGDRGSDMKAAMEAGINGIWASFGLGINDSFPQHYRFYKIDSFDKIIDLLYANRKA